MDLATLIALSPGHICSAAIPRGNRHAYDSWRAEALERFGDIGYAIEYEIFNVPARIDDSGPATRLKLQGRAAPNSWRLVPNKFPYKLGVGLRHYTLWATAPPTSLEQVDAMLKVEAPNTVHWFMSAPKHSPPTLFHVHVIASV
jgi:hypothetical protein